MNTEGRIFFCQFLQGDAHFFLVSFSFRFNCNGDYRIREYHRFEDDLVFLIAESITGSGVFQTYSSCDITGVNLFNFFAVVSMHLQDTTDTLAFTFSGVIYIRTSSQGTGVYTEECQLTNKRVGSNLECQCRERSFVAGRTLIFFAGFRVYTFDVRNICRCRHELDYSVQHRLNAFVFVGRTAANRSHFASDSCFTDTSQDFFFGQLFAFQIFHHQLVIGFSNSFNQCCTVFLSFFFHVSRDFYELFFFTECIIINDCSHFDQVDHALESIFKADRQLNRYCIGIQTGLHHVNYTIEVCTGNIHFIYICHTGYMVFVSLTPYGFGLRLNTALSTENCNGTIKYTQGTFNFYSKVNVTRGINDIDTMFIELVLGTFPVAGGCSRGDGNTTLLFLTHPVHGSSTFMGFTNLMYSAGIEQNTFGCGGFTSIDVSHDADISSSLKRN